MDVLKKIGSIQRRYSKLAGEVRETKDEVVAEIQKILSAHPTLSVRVVTFTPSFMDGDPLYKTTYYTVIDSNIEDVYEEGINMQEMAAKGIPELPILCAHFTNYCVDLLELYGVDQKILITATAVTQEDCDCGY